MRNSDIYMRNTSGALFSFLAISLFLGGYAMMEIVGEPAGNTEWYISIITCSSIWILLYLFAAWRTFNHVYLFSTAYLVALLLFHLGQFYLRAFGMIKFPISWEQGGGFSPWLENAGWHIILALSAFGVGFVFSILTGKSYPKTTNPQAKERIKKMGYWSAIGLLTASAVFFMFALYSYGNLLNYARHEIFSSHVDSRGFGVFMMVFPGSVLLYFFSAVTNRQRLIGYALALFAFLMFMLSGYRSAALFPALVGVALWVKSGRKLPFPVAVGGIVLVLILIAASGYLRTMGKYSEIDADEVSKALSKADIDSSIAEMGASVKALASVLQLVPKTDDYRYGSSYLNSIVDSIPNVGFNIDIEGSRSYALGKGSYDSSIIRQMRPADWLTYRIAPWHFKHGYGVGFSAIAEPFLNFGTFGVFLFFLILGYGLGRLDSIPIFQNTCLFIFSTSTLWVLVRTVRNDSSNFFKPFFFILIILSVWWIFSRILFNKKFRCRV